MLLLCNNLNDVLNLSCMRNSKLVGLGPTHGDATSDDTTVCNIGMPVRLAETECNTMGLIKYRYSPLLAYYCRMWVKSRVNIFDGQFRAYGEKKPLEGS